MVHTNLASVLDSEVYYRLNPHMSHVYMLDEIAPDRLDCMQRDARMFETTCSLQVETCNTPAGTSDATRPSYGTSRSSSCRSAGRHRRPMIISTVTY